MIEVLLICAIATVFTPPAEWSVVKIEPAGSHMYPEGTQRWPVRVHLRKRIKPGEAVTPPAGCRADQEALALDGAYVIQPWGIR